MKTLEEIKILIAERDRINKVLAEYRIEANRIEKRQKQYVIQLGGMNRSLWQQNIKDIEQKLSGLLIICK